MTRFAMLIEYEGTDFYGWQLQLNQRTVQGDIEQALKIILKEEIRVHGAGRTDSGVHASGQVAHFDCLISADPAIIKRSLNGILKNDVRIRSLRIVPDDFHARFSAVSRMYRYTIATSPVAIQRQFSWLIHNRLDLEKMTETARLIATLTDFEAFCKIKSEVGHYHCTIEASFLSEDEQFLVYEIRANRFLHGMVRALTGTIVAAGLGKIEPTDLLEMAGSRDRTLVPITAPARGLCLCQVNYNENIF